MFAIVTIAGYQEKVEKGLKLRVPFHAEAKIGDSLTFDQVLLIADGDKVTVGAPQVSGASVTAKVVTHGKGDKIRVVKHNRRKRYKRVKGHRQMFTDIEVTGIKA